MPAASGGPWHLQGDMTAKELDDYVERFLSEELDDPEVQRC